MDEKLTDWEKEYLEHHLPDKITNIDFYFDNPSAAIDDIKFLLELIKKLRNVVV